jgi:hypothetical protein
VDGEEVRVFGIGGGVFGGGGVEARAGDDEDGAVDKEGECEEGEGEFGDGVFERVCFGGWGLLAVSFLDRGGMGAKMGRIGGLLWEQSGL